MSTDDCCVEATYKTSIVQKLKWKLQRFESAIKNKTVSLCLAIIRLIERDSNYIKHAQREFEVMYKDLPAEDMDGPNTWIRDNIIDLLAVLGTQGHSGSSIDYCLSRFDAAARFKCLSALTGADDEWGESYSNDESKQNKRMSEIFKDSDGKAYTIYGYVFREPNGSCFTGKGSIKYIEFPYVYEPPIYIDVDEAGIPISEEHRILTGRFE